MEGLCKCDESCVRDEASKNLKSYFGQLDIKKHEELVVSMIKRLYDSTYSVSKGPAAHLIPAVY